ncbi:MAG: lytic transglycosylase domain-containing protein [Paracoccaceae bacterium]
MRQRFLPLPRPAAARALLSALAAVLALSGPARADDPAALKLALDRASVRDWPAAQSAAAASGPLAADIIEWQRLRAGGQGYLGDYETFLDRHPDWPGLPLLVEKGEEAVARSSTPARIIGYFARQKPATVEGSLALIRACIAADRPADAEAEAFRAWTTLRFDADQEQALMALEGPALVVAHEVRLDNLLWSGRLAEARRMLPRVSPDWRALAEARIALMSDDDGVNAKIAAVPASLAHDPGLAYDRFVWRMKRDRYDDAASLILQYSDSRQHLGRPEAWADRRLLLARWLMRNGKERDAYRVAARHNLSGGADYADLEFLAGFIALRKLGDPETAARHFGHLQGAVSTGISLSRAHYWLGRADEAKGDAAAARAEYRTAAKYQTAFYGLLAAEKLDLTLDPALLSPPRPTDWKAAPFTRSSVFQAARLLLQAGDRQTGKRFLLHLAQGLDARGLEQLSAMATDMGEPHVALLIAKAAAERGQILPGAYYPVPDMVPDGGPVSRALALAISRRESEFDPAVISHAGARGLMQVMPGTAQMLAGRIGLPFDAGRLTSDPAYNVSMGTAYLRQLVDEFGPSIALVAAGYNAGHNRPEQWMAQFGDPRRPDVDVIDWIETIPFAETRTYVMRVAESVVIYRARLKGVAGPVRITPELKG